MTSATPYVAESSDPYGLSPANQYPSASFRTTRLTTSRSGLDRNRPTTMSPGRALAERYTRIRSSCRSAGTIDGPRTSAVNHGARMLPSVAEGVGAE